MTVPAALPAAHVGFAVPRMKRKPMRAIPMVSERYAGERYRAVDASRRRPADNVPIKQ